MLALALGRLIAFGLGLFPSPCSDFPRQFQNDLVRIDHSKVEDLGRLDHAHAVAISRNGEFVAVVSLAGNLFCGDPRTPPLKDLGRLPSPDCRLVFSPQGHELAIYSTGVLHLVDLDASFTTGHWRDRVAPLKIDGGSPGSLRYSGSGALLACGSHAGSITVIDSELGQVKKVFEHPGTGDISPLKGEVALAAFDASGQNLVVVGKDRFLRLMSLDTGKWIGTPKFLAEDLPGYKGVKDITEISDVDATPDGSFIAIGAICIIGRDFSYWNTLIKVTDSAGKTLINLSSRVRPEDHYNRAVSITPDGKFVMSAAPGGISIWPSHGGQPTYIPTGDPAGLSKSMAGYFDQGTYGFITSGRKTDLIAVKRDGPSRTLNQQAGASDAKIMFDSPSDPDLVSYAESAEVSVHIRGVAPDAKVQIRAIGSKTSLSEAANTLNGRGAEQIIGPDGDAETKWDNILLRAKRTIPLLPGENRIRVSVIEQGHDVANTTTTVCCIPRSAGDSLPYKANRALVIGVDEYKGQVGPLKYAVSDARAFASLLEKSYGFKHDDIVLLENADANANRIRSELNRLRDSSMVDRQDRIVIYFSGHGHGLFDPRGQRVGFIIPGDAFLNYIDLGNFGKLSQECVPMQEFVNVVQQSPSQHILVLLDACFSGISTDTGTVPTPDINPNFHAYESTWRASRTIISASSDDELSTEGQQFATQGNGHGYFTQCLLEFMSSKNQPFWLGELAADLLATVPTMNPRQHPTVGRFSAGLGDLIWIPHPDSSSKSK